jgi:two-component system, chemotaxis family, sensor histidine kinase and response regulator WspE
VKPSDSQDLSNLSMLELFRVEAENQTAVLSNGLLELERGSALPQSYEALMRAAHSLKGAARIVNLQAAEQLAHALEDCFVAAQKGKLLFQPSEIDTLLRGIDLLALLAKRPLTEVDTWEKDHAAEIRELLGLQQRLLSLGNKGVAADASPSPASTPASHRGRTIAPQQPPASSPLVRAARRGMEPALPPSAEGAAKSELAAQALALRQPESPERVLRLTAENLNRLLALAGESLVESRWLRPFADSLQRLKRHHMDLSQQLERLRQALEDEHLSERSKTYFSDLLRQVADSQQFLAERMQELDMYDRRSAHLSQRLYLEVLRTRMRPFSDGVRRFPRMVRDLARALGKEIKLEISGENTQVDRDILERLETPLAHLLRNAVDHGCEPPEIRRQRGKPAECCLRLEARHSAGVLLVTVADDGGGVDLERVRRAIVEKRLTTPAMARKLTESELLDFLFLPGFTLKETVTEISGRGFGLDVVQNMVKSVRGAVRVSNQSGRSLRVQLQLPLTLSVLRALLVEVAGEPYAIPLSQITRTLKVPLAAVGALEGRHHFHFGDQQVGLLTANQVLECGQPSPPSLDLPVVVLGDRTTRYGLIVDRFLGERELVVQPLDSRLGKVKDISAAALMEDGAPVLIVDVEDMVRSIEKLIAQGQIDKVQRPALKSTAPAPKRVLAVDDSLTVRELERKLISARGYVADVAVDGMDAWNAVRSGNYDLVITDVDMPRMDGIELTTLIKKDPRLKNVPVLIVSYKDREEDRVRGLEAGADYYLTKGSFHDETLLQAVVDLIGEAEV